eukprot:2694714-Amphidinium_carterae.2
MMCKALRSGDAKAKARASGVEQMNSQMASLVSRMARPRVRSERVPHHSDVHPPRGTIVQCCILRIVRTIPGHT